MVNDHAYDAVLANRLQPHIVAADWTALRDVLSRLSNAQFRTAGNMLGGRLSLSLNETDFWQLFTQLVCINSRAFLGTMLKQVANRVTIGTLQLSSSEAHTALSALSANPIDAQKTLIALIPLCDTPNEVENLFTLLHFTPGESRLPILLPCTTLPACFALFSVLKYEEHNRSLLLRTAYYLMKRGDDRSFNLASLLKTYFGLDELKGTFSLHFQPFQLQRIAESYETFVAAIG